MELGMDFDELAEENTESAKMKYTQSKARQFKIPALPPLPALKTAPRASAGAIRETKKLIKEKQESAQIGDKIRILTKIELYCQNFPDIANNKKKYPNLSIKNMMEEIFAQHEEIKRELASGKSVVLTKLAFIQFTSLFENLCIKLDLGPNTAELTKKVQDPIIFKKSFDDYLTRIAIEHDLFSTGPKMGLLMEFAGLVGAVHLFNTMGVQVNRPTHVPTEVADRYADC